jgi:hypothetical protein
MITKKWGADLLIAHFGIPFAVRMATFDVSGERIWKGFTAQKHPEIGGRRYGAYHLQSSVLLVSDKRLQ